MNKTPLFGFALLASSAIACNSTQKKEEIVCEDTRVKTLQVAEAKANEINGQVYSASQQLGYDYKWSPLNGDQQRLRNYIDNNVVNGDCHITVRFPNDPPSPYYNVFTCNEVGKMGNEELRSMNILPDPQNPSSLRGYVKQSCLVVIKDNSQ